MTHLPRLSLAFLWVLVVAACSRGEVTRAATTKPPGWYEIARTPEITAYLDTARIEREQPGVARIWFRFHYANPISVGADTAARFAATETRQELDCPGRRTRGLELRMETTRGITAAVPTPDGSWSSIDTHVLNSGIFLVACRAIGHPIPVAPSA